MPGMLSIGWRLDIVEIYVKLGSNDCRKVKLDSCDRTTSCEHDISVVELIGNQLVRLTNVFVVLDNI